jgi:hypothetical protein
MLDKLHQLPRACTFDSATVHSSRSRSRSSSLALFSPNKLPKLTTYLLRAVCSAILLRYYYRAPSALVLSTSREALTWARAFPEILAFSFLSTRASSLRMSFPSRASRSSTTAADGTAAGPENDGGGGLHRAYEDELTTRQVTFQHTTMNGRSLTS